MVFLISHKTPVANQRTAIGHIAKPAFHMRNKTKQAQHRHTC